MKSLRDLLAFIAIFPLLAMPGELGSVASSVADGPFRAEKLSAMNESIEAAIQSGRCPGGVLWIERNGHSYHKAFGRRAVVPSAEPMTEDTIFDAASLTKVVACTPAIMMLIEQGAVEVDARVSTYIPEFVSNGKDQITVRQLLTHTSGLRGDIETSSDWSGQKAAIEKACAEKLLSKPGTAFRYSDINFFLLGEIVQRVSGQPLEMFVQEKLYEPLGMHDTGYKPGEDARGRIAPTEVVDGVAYRGVVHDPTARKMGGVAGHAGLFTTANDLAIFCRMLLNGGRLGETPVLKEKTVEQMISVQTPVELEVRRGFGWDIDSGYSGPRGKWFPVGSYGHTGWTGTSVWIDPFSKAFVIFLSNRNHPDERGNVGALRAQLGTLAAEAIPDYNFVYVPGALTTRTGQIATVSRVSRTVLNGIDVLGREKFARLKGLRVGLITNHTGHDRRRNSTIDLMLEGGVALQALFSPEHGIRGKLDEKVVDSSDEKTGLPVFSLYGESRKPKPEQLRNLDALVYDIQDIGCRFYTYTATMAMAMEAAAEQGLKFFVLDRVNPIDGLTIEGPVHRGAPTFVGYHNVPLRYGMTIGELARMFQQERHCAVDLTVIPVENWTRSAYMDDTGLPWTNPSPNMRSLTAAVLYPGVGLLESALSVGRGTDSPFEVVGAPYIDDVRFASELNSAGLQGVTFIPVRFTPSTSIHKAEACGGVNIVLTDRRQCQVVDVGIVIAKTAQRLYPDKFDIQKLKHLLLSESTLEGIRKDKPLAEIKAEWKQDLDEFAHTRRKYLLY